MPRPRPHPDHPLHPGASPGPRSEPPDRTAAGLARAGSAPVAPGHRPASDLAFRGHGPAVGAGAVPRPRWRGRLHLAAFVASLPAGIALCATASSTSARIAVAVYSVTVSAVFGVSAAFHLVAWSPAGRRRMDRLDRAMIYLQIAGTYTPVSLLALDRELAIAVLAVIWAGAVPGAAIVLRWGNIRGVSLAIYMVLGWPSVVVLPFALGRVHPLGVALLLAGGVIYTAGAIMLVRRWPNPIPAVFGYHEVWHVLTIVAGACHWSVVWYLAHTA